MAKVSRKCSKTLVCGVGSCCRGSDNKVIPAALQQFTDIDWWRAQIGINPGNCTQSPATEGRPNLAQTKGLYTILANLTGLILKVNSVIRFVCALVVFYAHQTFFAKIVVNKLASFELVFFLIVNHFLYHCKATFVCRASL